MGKMVKVAFTFYASLQLIFHQDKAGKLLKIKKKKKKRIAIKNKNKKNTTTVTYSLVVTKFPGGRDDMTERNKTHVNLLEYGGR